MPAASFTLGKPLSLSLFASLNLPPEQLANFETLGYREMTPIQVEALPAALNGQDLIAQAKTGSGKTVAFGIPLVHKINAQDSRSQALVLCPTRELSIQVTNEIRKLARYQSNVKVVTLYGGQLLALQKSALKNDAHIIVGTPGRIKDHLAKQTISLESIQTLVLDEADRMLEMGFLNDITDIIKATPGTRQTLFFSATFPENIQILSSRFQKNPTHIQIESESAHSEIEQKFVLCDKDQKPKAVAALLAHFQPDSAIVFCNTKAATHDVYEDLIQMGYSAAVLNGDLEQRDREHVLMRFRHQSCRVLVATDVAARGLDIEDLSMVINFEIPHDSETYVHRIGRTGRAGKNGQAFTLAATTEQFKIQAIRDALNSQIPQQKIENIAKQASGALVSKQVTLCIAAGRKDSLRAGDILGALTREGGVEGKSVGKIDVMDYEAFVTVERKWLKKAFSQLSENKIKGKKFKVRILE